ncbi:MAG: TonB C-terminal domain-containing protein [Clostridiaceae bacterium]|jgi:hypothetical protein|nr:TonB C-terminal domain-containing protein [Clostridiaceae bacterium]
MKKVLLIMALFMMAAGCVNATQWVNIETKNNNLLLSVDKDYVDYEKADTCFFPLMVTEMGKSSRVLFLKADYKNGRVGIIREDDYEPAKYNPMYVYNSYEVYMKPVIKNTIIDIAYKYMACKYEESKDAQNYCNDRLVSTQPQKEEVVTTPNTAKAISQLKKTVLSNWKLPSQGKDKEGIIFIVIGKQGGLSGYNIIQSTGNETADRAMISAVELSAPFKNLESTTMRLKFKSKLFRKTVE